MSFVRTIVFLASSVVLSVALLETYFRMPWTPRLLEFDYDPELLYRYSPGQTNAVIFLGNYSVQSPSIRINSRGYRGADIGPGQPRILVIGSSEVVGPGVREDETIAARLQSQLSQRWPQAQVLNAATGGYGPGHQLVVLERELSRHSFDLVIIRVSVSDASFDLPTTTQLEAERESKAQRDRLRRLARSSPFIVNRIRAQVNSVTARFDSFLAEIKQPTGLARPGAGEAAWERHADYWASMVGAANDAGVQAVFFVPNGERKAGNTFLCNAIDALPGEKSIWEYGPTDFRVRSTGDYRARFTLGYDPHGNPQRYRRLAEMLSRDIQSKRSNQCG